MGILLRMSTRGGSLMILLSLACCVLCSACQEEDLPPDGVGDDDTSAEIDIELSEVVPTVVTVRWASDRTDVTDAYVEFGVGDGPVDRAPATATDDGFEALLLGIPADTEAWLRPVVEDEDGSAALPDQTVTTGSAPSVLLDVDLGVAGEVGDDARFLLTTVLSIPSYAVILDRDGNYVWWYTDPDPEFEAWPITRAHLTPDKRSVVMLPNRIPGGDEEPEGQHLSRVTLDGVASEPFPIDLVHNDFVILPDDSYAVLMEDRQIVDDEPIWGDQLVEFAADGTSRVVWSVWDHEPFNPEIVQDGRWSHANALDYSVEEDMYYLGARHLSAIYKIERETGTQLWKLGRSGSDFDAVGGEDELFAGQHQFQLLPGGLVVFDNGNDIPAGSRAVEYSLDGEAWEIEQIWEYRADPILYCVGLGDVSRLRDGNTIVTWSSNGVLEEVSPEGEVLWELNAEIGGGFGYLTPLESLY